MTDHQQDVDSAIHRLLDQALNTAGDEAGRQRAADDGHLVAEEVGRLRDYSSKLLLQRDSAYDEMKRLREWSDTVLRDYLRNWPMPGVDIAPPMPPDGYPGSKAAYDDWFARRRAWRAAEETR